MWGVRAERVWSWVRARPPHHILVTGFAVLVLYGFPGYMSTDSVTQLAEARSGELVSQHPPIMAKQWGVLDAIVAGPILMLLLQGALFLGGLYVIGKKFLAPKPAAWFAIGVLLYPPVLTTMAVIWKDSQMAAYLVAGIAALLHERLRIRVAGLGLLVVACAFRQNALAAVVPVVVFVFEWKPGIRWWKRFAILAVAATASVGLALGLSKVLAVDYVRLSPVIADVAGMVAFTDDKSDDEVREILVGVPIAVEHGIQERARLLYKMGGAYRLTMGPDRLFHNPRSDAEWDAFGRAWKRLASEDPAAYFASHWFLFQRVLGLEHLPRGSVWDGFLEHPAQHTLVAHNASHSWLQTQLKHFFVFLAEDTPLFLPFVYAAIAIMLLVLCCRDRLTLALYASGLLYELSYFPSNADPDYRYSHWLIASATIATVLVFVQRWRKRR
jgi:hypothetical protein